MENNLNNKIDRKDKYKAVWLSHSSMQDFEKCPRLYYLHNIYKNENGRKINIVGPYMSLGIAVHNVMEALKTYKTEDRKEKIQNFLHDFDLEWEKVSGKKGGFKSDEEEREFKSRGVTMLQNVMLDPKVLLNKTISTKSYYDGDMLPNFYISEEDNIILCGNVDWIEYVDDTNSLRVVDFKTGRNEEKEDSPQLFIYKLLIERLGCKWPVTSGAYWYLESGEVVNKNVLDEKFMNELIEKVISIGVKIRDMRYEWSDNAKFGKPGWVEKKDFEKNFACSGSEYCECKKFEKIIMKDVSVEYLGVDGYGKDSYFIN